MTRRTRRRPQPQTALQGRYQTKLSRPGTTPRLIGTRRKTAMDDLTRIYSERGDLALLALFLCVVGIGTRRRAALQRAGNSTRP